MSDPGPSRGVPGAPIQRRRHELLDLYARVARDKGDAHRVHPATNGERKVGVMESVTGELLDERAAAERGETPTLEALVEEMAEGVREVGRGGTRVGRALTQVHDLKRFEEKGYTSFDDFIEGFVKPTYGFGRTQVFRLMTYATVEADVSPNGDDPLLLEAHARELAHIEEPDGRRVVWAHVNEVYAGEITAVRISEEVSVYLVEKQVLAPDDPRRAIVLDQVRADRERKKVLTRPKPKARPDAWPHNEEPVAGVADSSDGASNEELASPDPRTAVRWMKALIELTAEAWESIRDEDPGTVEYFGLYCRDILKHLPVVTTSAI